MSRCSVIARAERHRVRRNGSVLDARRPIGATGSPPWPAGARYDACNQCLQARFNQLDADRTVRGFAQSVARSVLVAGITRAEPLITGRPATPRPASAVGGWDDDVAERFDARFGPVPEEES